MSQTNIIWVAVLLAACAAGILVASPLQQNPPPEAGTPDQATWSKKVAENAASAYDEFKREYASAPFAAQHETAHTIGILLYTSSGLSGISICDESFAFGCYHGFFGRVIADKGAGVVPDLAKKCREQYGAQGTGCEHGIGHGIMEYTGRDKLLEGLELCKKTGQVNELYGCTSGLFMEYNRLMTFRDGAASVDERPIDMKDPLAPCNSIVPAPYRTSCYFEIGLWWKGQLGADYETIGNLCTKAATQAERNACYRGWGTVVAESVDHNPAEAKKTCGLIRAPSGADMCTLGVASRFFPAGYPEAGRKMCAGLSGTLAQECSSLSPQDSSL